MSGSEEIKGDPSPANNVRCELIGIGSRHLISIILG